MKITKLELHNFRSARASTFRFNEKLNLFIGINGSGKSTVLDALSICLSWLVKRIEKEKGRGSYILDSNLTNGEKEGHLNICLTNNDSLWSWRLAKTANVRSSKIDSNFNEVSKLAKILRDSHEEHLSWPIISYYPVNRVVKDIRPMFPDKDSIYNLDVYENALGGKTNYQSFFEWFRVQDDILNEKSTSRSKWMKKNSFWIKKKIRRLFSLLEETLQENEKQFDREEFKYIIKRFEKDEMIYEEPRFLFRELSHVIDMMGMHTNKHFNYKIIFHDLEYMFHKMASLSSEFRDDLIENGGMHEEIVFRVIQNFEHVSHDEKPDVKMVYFLWEAFIFSLLLSLWWFSDKGKRNIENELSMQLKFINDRDKNYQTTMAKNLTETLRQIIKREVDQIKKTHHNEGQELQIVTNAIEQFLPEYNNLRVKRTPRPHMLIDKNEETFDLEQLSVGEKNLIALVGDIARRMSLGNPRTNNPLIGNGIILIDEIDLHLHPSWQRLVVPKLLEVFPNCQFFISTHSPQILSHVKPDSVFLLEQDEEGLSYRKAEETYGMSLDRVVELVMEDESRPEFVGNDFEKIFELIERNKLKQAKKLIITLKKDMKTDPEIMRAEMLIRQQEMSK